MRILFVALFLISTLKGEESPQIQGVWTPDSSQGLICMCNHETQLLIIGDPNRPNIFEVVEYCLGHRTASALGTIVVEGKILRFINLKCEFKFSLVDNGATLKIRGNTAMGDRALVLRKGDISQFEKKLNGIPSFQLQLGRGSFLLAIEEATPPDPRDPFAGNP